MDTRRLIVVVCGGNIHRSPIAEFCLNKALELMGLNEKVVVISRGLQGSFGNHSPIGKNLKDYPLEWSFSKPALERLKIDISGHQATPIESSVIERASVVLAMDKKILGILIARFPENVHKMHLFRELRGESEDVPDCFGCSKEKTYEETIELIKAVSTGRLGMLLG